MSKGNILVVEDNLASLRLLTETLNTAGYSTLPADSGALALAAVANARPELILLDLRLPMMDGFDVIHHLKAHETTRNIPVIFLSATEETNLRVEGFRLGAVDFISKPYQREELLARVSTHLELFRLRADLEQKSVTQLREANERLEHTVNAQTAYLRQLAGELTHAEQRERDRLYALLHDEVQPLLVAARLSLSSLSSRTPTEDLLRVTRETCAHISQILQVARNLSLQLSPPLINERGLVSALESLARWVRSNHQLDVELCGTSDAEPEDVAVRLHCFNAVRELLMNIVKHAGVSRARVTLECPDSVTLRIIVADCGCSFDSAELGNGSGLATISQRLSMFGGKLQINGQPGVGTTVTILAPLQSAGVKTGRRHSDTSDKEATC